MTLETTRAREATEHVDDSSDRPHKIGERIRNEIARIPVPTTATADYRWIRVSLSSGSADTPSYFLQDADVVGKQIFLVSFIGRVNGANAWTAGTMTKVEIMDTTGLNVFMGIPLAALLNNAQFYVGAPGVTLFSPFTLRTGTPTGKGLKLVADGMATSGSSLYITALVKIE